MKNEIYLGRIIFSMADLFPNMKQKTVYINMKVDIYIHMKVYIYKHESIYIYKQERFFKKYCNLQKLSKD